MPAVLCFNGARYFSREPLNPQRFPHKYLVNYEKIPVFVPEISAYDPPVWNMSAHASHRKSRALS